MSGFMAYPYRASSIQMIPTLRPKGDELDLLCSVWSASASPQFCDESLMTRLACHSTQGGLLQPEPEQLLP